MAINANAGEPRKLIPAKTYTAVLVGIYDLGTRTGQYGDYRMILFRYELWTRRGWLRDEQGNKLSISQFLPVNLGIKGPSDLRIALEALTGKAITAKNFAIDESLLEKMARVTVKHEEVKGVMRDNISATVAVDPDEDPVPDELDSDTFYFEIDPADLTIPDEVPKWVADMIRKQAKEFAGARPDAKGEDAPKKAARKAVPAGGPPDDDDDDPIPY